MLILWFAEYDNVVTYIPGPLQNFECRLDGVLEKFNLLYLSVLVKVVMYFKLVVRIVQIQHCCAIQILN